LKSEGFNTRLEIAPGIPSKEIRRVACGLTNVIQKYLDWSGNTRAVIYLRRLFGFLVLCGGIYFLYQYVL